MCVCMCTHGEAKVVGREKMIVYKQAGITHAMRLLPEMLEGGKEWEKAFRFIRKFFI